MEALNSIHVICIAITKLKLFKSFKILYKFSSTQKKKQVNYLEDHICNSTSTF